MQYSQKTRDASMERMMCTFVLLTLLSRDWRPDAGDCCCCWTEEPLLSTGLEGDVGIDAFWLWNSFVGAEWDPWSGSPATVKGAAAAEAATTIEPCGFEV